MGIKVLVWFPGESVPREVVYPKSDCVIVEPSSALTILRYTDRYAIAGYNKDQWVAWKIMETVDVNNTPS